MTDEHANFDEPTQGWRRSVMFTFLFACLYFRDKQLST